MAVPWAGFWAYALTTHIFACLSNFGGSGFPHDLNSLMALKRAVDFQHVQSFSFCEDRVLTSNLLIRHTGLVQKSVSDVLSSHTELKVPLLYIFPFWFFFPLLPGGLSSSGQKEYWFFYQGCLQG